MRLVISGLQVVHPQCGILLLTGEAIDVGGTIAAHLLPNHLWIGDSHGSRRHIIEWQGWTDAVVLWRGMSYLGWMGQHRPERPILLTIIYLKPSDDVGDTLVQELPGQPGWMIRVPCVRLWEQDAQQAIASGLPGLLALSPLMHGATDALVEEAAQQLLRTTQPPMQADLLTALGVFAEPIFSAERFLHMITKERLMSSDLFTLVYGEQLAEMEQERAQWREAMQQAVESVFINRFPLAPAKLIRSIRQIRDVKQLQAVLDLILTRNDSADVEQAIDAAVAADTSSL